MNGLEPGTLLAERFEITGPPVGRGSSGVVFPARDVLADVDVVVKVVHAHLADEPEEVRQLQKAAGAASRLRHAHINPVIGLFSHDGRWMLVSERVRGDTLAQASETRLPVEAVLAYGVQLADALATTHGAGIVHGDVRPGAVLVGAGGVRLFDFGLASTMGLPDHEAVRVRRPGITAPEVHAGAPPGPSADLYGLGVVLHRAVTGEMPFRGDSPWAVIGAQRAGAPAIDRAPRGVAALVRSLLNPDPTRRPHDAAAVRDALIELQRDPDKLVRPAWRWLPPIRPRRNWVVHGTDPSTGGPALLAKDLSRGRARSLARQLRSQGWEAAADKEGIGGRDLAFILGPSAVAGLLFPVFGAIASALVLTLYVSSTCRPAIRERLPSSVTPLPDAALAVDRGEMVAIGLLMLFTALWLVVFPPVGLMAAGLLALVFLERWRTRETPVEVEVARARTIAALSDARLAIEASDLDLDAALARQGEIEAIEASWRRGDLPPEAARKRAAELRADLPQQPGVGETEGERAARALRAARAEVGATGRTS